MKSPYSKLINLSYQGDELALPGSDEEEKRTTVEMTERDRLKRAKRRGIDPMDPAAYGDVPEGGGWNQGLREVR